jgi:hypothetical protein
MGVAWKEAMPTRGAALLLLLLAACAHAPSRTDDPRPASSPRAEAAPEAATKRPDSMPPEAVDFVRDVRPILEARCQPCHFPGGKMYGELPFDRAGTVRGLGTKLFTRIKAAEEKAVIERFLAQP